MKNQAACILCFAQRQFVRGTMSTMGGGGLSRHLYNHHVDEYELLEGMEEKTMKDKTDACSNNPGGAILAYYKPKPSEMSLLELEMKSLYSLCPTFIRRKRRTDMSHNYSYFF